MKNIFLILLRQLKIKKAAASFNKKAVAGILLSLLLLPLGGAGNPGSETDPIVLRPEALPFTPEEFYIAGVTDERQLKNAVAWVYPLESASAQNPTLQPVDLKGGGLYSIRQFIKQSLPADTALRPVFIRLRECKIVEGPSEQGSVEGTVIISMAFELKRGEEFIPLTEYKGSARYIRSSRQNTIIEKALRQSLSSSLKYLNNWMNQEAPHNIKLAKGIKIFFDDFIQQAAGDTVFYEASRPISWNDFLAKPSSNKYAASVFPNFGYDNSSEVVNGYLHLRITMRVFMLKNMSWVRNDARDDYGLNHEQRHFDLAKLIAERFKQKILSQKLTTEDFDGVLGFLYIESYREMNRLQDQYDSETRHGLDQSEQARWNKQIDEDLKAFGIKKP